MTNLTNCYWHFYRNWHTHDIIGKLKKFSTEISSDGIFSAKNDKERIEQLNNVLNPLVDKYIIFNESGKIIYKSRKNIQLPKSYITDGLKSISDRDFTGNDYNMIISKDKYEIYFYMINII